MKMKTSVHDTRPVSQAHLDLSTAEIPKKMKMMVSAMLARVFMVYLTVVRDFWEMLASTYLLAPIPQKVILGGRSHSSWGAALVGLVRLVAQTYDRMAEREKSSAVR